MICFSLYDDIVSFHLHDNDGGPLVDEFVQRFGLDRLPFNQGFSDGSQAGERDTLVTWNDAEFADWRSAASRCPYSARPG